MAAATLPKPKDTVVHLANRSFSFPTSQADSARRRAFFLTRDGELKQNEKNLLEALGIDGEVQENVRQYLPEFFEKIPECSTDVNLQLRKDCEVPHFVLWTAMFHKFNTEKERLEALSQSSKPLTQLDHAMKDSLIRQLKDYKMDPVEQLFTLVLIDLNPPVPTDPVSRLFTLVLQP